MPGPPTQLLLFLRPPPPPQEWDAFIAALKRPLPITFRINGQGKFADRLVARLESNFMQQFTDEPVVVSSAFLCWLREALLLLPC